MIHLNLTDVHGFRVKKPVPVQIEKHQFDDSGFDEPENLIIINIVSAYADVTDEFSVVAFYNSIQSECIVVSIKKFGEFLVEYYDELVKDSCDGCLSRQSTQALEWYDEYLEME
jgi:hypothetical protein